MCFFMSTKKKKYTMSHDRITLTIKHPKGL